MGGAFGYFPTYSLGNLIAAELFSDFKIAKPSWSSKVETGNFTDVIGFLQERIHNQAALNESPTTIKNGLVGRELSATAFLDYIRSKYLK